MISCAFLFSSYVHKGSLSEKVLVYTFYLVSILSDFFVVLFLLFFKFSVDNIVFICYSITIK